MTVNMGAKVLLFCFLIVFYRGKHCFPTEKISFSALEYIVFSIGIHRIPALEYALVAVIFICHPSATTPKAPVYGALRYVGGRVAANFAKLILYCETYIYPNQRRISLRFANTISSISSPKPTYSARIMKVSDGLRRVIIS